MEDYLNQLNEQQRAAVQYLGGPQLVIAGAGSGKTRVLTYKIVHLLANGYAPYRIMALTFTNKAAREMKERIAQLVDSSTAGQLWMGTFHSIFSRILRLNADRIGFNRNFTIYDTTDSKSLIKAIIRDMGLDEKVYVAGDIQSHISKVKNCLISPADYAADSDLLNADRRSRRPAICEIYRAYCDRCHISGAMDFDDLLFYTNRLLRDNPDVLMRYREFFQYVLVDEYQDTNFAQHLIVSQLTGDKGNLCVVGDDAQSIYSFRGANISNIINMGRNYENLRIFKLEQNYRSTQNILDAANSLIEKNTEQIRKHIFSDNSRGSKVRVIEAYSDFEESYIVANQIITLRAVQGDSYDEFAVLYRTNAQSRVLEEALRKRNIPYRIYGGQSFYQRKEIKDAISYFRLAINPDDDEALRRIINYPARGIGETTLRKLIKASIGGHTSIWGVLQDLEAHEVDINAGTRRKLEAFRDMVRHFIDFNNETNPTASELGREIIKDTRLLAVIESDNTPENISRKENLTELLNSLDDFVRTKEEEENSDDMSMSDFLAEVSLLTDQDRDDDEDSEAHVTLMTVHAAKGLEFKNVIIVGVEENLFPSSMSCDSIAGVEEERRLLYVAITRAKATCTITYARSRYRNGQTQTCTASRFIKDIDPRYLSVSASSSSPSFSTPMGEGRPQFTWDGNRLSAMPARRESNVKVEPRNSFIGRQSSVTVASSATGNGDFTLHDAAELQPGMEIEHSRFGHGVIASIEAGGASDAKITVGFGDVGQKTLILKFARFKILK